MSRNTARRLALLALAAPLALGLSACSKDNGTAAAPSGEALEKVAAPAGKAWGDVVEKTADGGYRMGNPEAPIKLVEYASLTCSHCAEFAHEASAELRDTFVASGRVSWEFRNFVRDGIDITAAQLTRCGAPESFFALTDQVLANQGAIIQQVQAAGQQAFEAAMNQPDATRGAAIAKLAGLDEFFAARGIAKDQAAACLANAAEAQNLAKLAQEQGERDQITGTPTFLINGVKEQANSWPALKARLEALGAR